MIIFLYPLLYSSFVIISSVKFLVLSDRASGNVCWNLSISFLFSSLLNFLPRARQVFHLSECLLLCFESVLSLTVCMVCMVIKFLSGMLSLLLMSCSIFFGLVVSIVWFGFVMKSWPTVFKLLLFRFVAVSSVILNELMCCCVEALLLYSVCWFLVMSLSSCTCILLTFVDNLVLFFKMLYLFLFPVSPAALVIVELIAVHGLALLLCHASSDLSSWLIRLCFFCLSRLFLILIFSNVLFYIVFFCVFKVVC